MCGGAPWGIGAEHRGADGQAHSLQGTAPDLQASVNCPFGVGPSAYDLGHHWPEVFLTWSPWELMEARQSSQQSCPGPLRPPRHHCSATTPWVWPWPSQHDAQPLWCSEQGVMPPARWT